MEIVRAERWHTTEEYGTPDGRATIENLVNYLAIEDAGLVIVVESQLSDFGGSIEKARRYCFATLARVLADEHASDLIVYERRREGVEEDNDNTTVRLLQADENIRAELRFHAGTPYSEPLLWAPDIIASTFRRRIVHNQKGWFEPLRSKTKIVQARSGKQIALR